MFWNAGEVRPPPVRRVDQGLLGYFDKMNQFANGTTLLQLVFRLGELTGFQRSIFLAQV